MQYLKDAYPIFAFLAVWLDEQGLSDLTDRFSDILKAGVFAVAGYGILDANVDKNTLFARGNSDCPGAARRVRNPGTAHIRCHSGKLRYST